MIIQKLSIFVHFGDENCANVQNTLKIDDFYSEQAGAELCQAQGKLNIF